MPTVSVEEPFFAVEIATRADQALTRHSYARGNLALFTGQITADVGNARHFSASVLTFREMSCTSALGAPRAVVAVRARRAPRRARAPRAVPRAVSSGDAPGDAEKNLSRRDAVLSAAALASLAAAPSAFAAEPLKASFYDYVVLRDGEPFALDAFRGGVTVVLNVASE